MSIDKIPDRGIPAYLPAFPHHHIVIRGFLLKQACSGFWLLRHLFSGTSVLLVYSETSLTCVLAHFPARLFSNNV
jgi:hypothetical protein